MLAAHALWRRRRVEIDLVIVDEGATVYEQPLAEWLDREIARSGGEDWRDRPGGIFVVRSALMQPAERTLLEAVAATVLRQAVVAVAVALEGIVLQGEAGEHLMLEFERLAAPEQVGAVAVHEVVEDAAPPIVAVRERAGR